MKIIDLTHTLSETTTVYPGKTPFTRKAQDLVELGVHMNDISLSSGIGTHMDAPAHFVKKGKSIDQIPLEKCFAPACVFHLKESVQNNSDYAISALDIEKWERAHGVIPPHSIVLAHTGWDRFSDKADFYSLDDAGICHYPGFSASAAEMLVARKINGVGIDTLGIDPGCETQFPAHQVLLKEGIFIVEILANLEKLPPTGAMVYILPMKIKNAPEAPARAMAII